MTRAYHTAAVPPMSPIRSLPDPLQDSAGLAEATPLPPVPGYASAIELAEAALPGLPSTKRGINMKALAEGWAFIDRPGRGGGRLYRVADLPAVARQALFDRRATLAVTAPVGRPRGSDYFTRNPDVASAVEAYLSQRRVSARAMLKLLACDFADLPSRRSLQRFMANIQRERAALIASVRSPDHYKSRYRVALGRADADVTRAHECWELDTTKSDVITKGGRKMILGLIDLWSRRANFKVVDSESGQSVRRFLTDTIRAWGVMPESVMTDNGSGFINASIRSALDILGIEHRICPPGSPEKKPHIERVFGTFTRDRAELLAGYVGHSVADAQELRARAKKETGRALILPEMTPDELQGVLTAWLDGEYHLRDHSSLRMPPMRKWQSSPVPARTAPAEDTLRLALSALVGQRKVGKRGLVWQGGRYWSPVLAEWMGRDVLVRRDEDNLGELIVFAPDGRFLDIAVNHERSGLSEAEFAMAARRDQDAFMREARADLRARSRKYSFEKARDQLLRDEAERAGKLVPFPLPTVAHSTPALDSLATAVANDSTAANTAPPPRASATVTPMPVSLEQRMRETDAILARAATGEPVDPAELARAQRYTLTSDYRSARAVADYAASLNQQKA